MTKVGIAFLFAALIGEHRLSCSWGDEIDKCPTYPKIQEAMETINKSNIKAR